MRKPPRESRPTSGPGRDQSCGGGGGRSRTSRDVERGGVGIRNRGGPSFATVEEREERKSGTAMPRAARGGQGLARNGDSDVATLVELALEQRGRIFDCALESIACEPALVENDADAPAALLLAIDPDQASDPGRGAPVDGADVLAGPVIAQAMDFLTHPDAACGLVALPHEPVDIRLRRRHFPGKDDELGRGVDRPRFLEEPERRPGDDLDLLEAVQTPPCGREAIRRLLRRRRREQDEERISGDVASALADLQREGWRAALAVLHGDPDERRGTGDRHVGQATLHVDALDGALRQDAGDDDAGEEEPEDEKEQVVAGIHRREADGDAEPDIPAADPREAESPAPGRRLRPARDRGNGRRRGGAHWRRWEGHRCRGDTFRCRGHTGTGTCSAISRMARSEASRSRPGRTPP